MAKIVQMITKLEFGGAQINTLYTCEKLIERGHKVSLITSGGKLIDKAKRIEGLELIILDAMQRKINPIKDFITIIKLVKIFNKMRPDLIHTHSSKAGILGRLSAKISGIKAIHTIHGFGITPLQNIFLRKILIFIERICAEYSEKLIAVSKNNIEKGLGWRIGKPEQYEVIRSGIKFDYRVTEEKKDILRKEFNIKNEIVIGSVSCLKPQKNPLMLVEIAKRIDAKFILVGDGELRKKVENKIKEYGLEDRFLLIGWRNDARDIISILDCFVLTSLWEGLPRVLLETIDSDVPSVVSSADGNPEAVINGVNGFVLDPFDLDGYVDRIKYVLENKPIFKSNIMRIKNNFINEFSIEVMGDKITGLIEKLCS